MEFSGNPKRYFRIAVIGSIALNAYLYFGLTAIMYFWHDQTWLLGWKPILFTVLFTAWFARTAFRWIMRLDAQYGTGKGWRMVSQSVKLPEPAHRKK